MWRPLDKSGARVNGLGHRTRSSGFTLIELMIVTAIFGIFVGGYDRFIGVYFQRFLQEKYIIDSGREARQISTALLGDMRSTGKINTRPRSLSQKAFRVTLRDGLKVAYQLSNGTLKRSQSSRRGESRSVTLAVGLLDVELNYEPSSKNIRTITMVCRYENQSKKTLEFVAGISP